jgi:hypothetical protein
MYNNVTMLISYDCTILYIVTLNNTFYDFGGLEMTKFGGSM